MSEQKKEIKYNYDELYSKISKAKLFIVTLGAEYDIQLFSYLLLNAKIKIIPREIEGFHAYSDMYGNVYIVDEVVANNKIPVIASIILHEILHSVRDDVGRIKGMKDEDMRTWNFVADAFINEWLASANMQLPVGSVREEHLSDVLHGRLYEYTTEQVYNLLIKNKRKTLTIVNGCGLDKKYKKLKSEGKLQPLSNKLKVNKEGASLDGKDKKEDFSWTEKLKEGMDIVKTQGKLPSPYSQAIEYELLKPKISWNLILNKMLRSFIPKEYSIAKFDEVMWTNFKYWLPDITGQEHEVIYAIDTSGSISKEEFDEAITELNNLITKYDAKAFLITCDATVQSAQYIRNKLPDKVEYAGGGTDFRPVFNYIAKELNNGRKFAALIYFTDGYGTYPEKNTLSIPVIWLLTTDSKDNKPPFGEVIYYNTKGEAS
jgi:predicted metal-dependent peptidase